MSHFLTVQEPISIPELERWRFAPYDRTILFNFKDKVQSENEAIAIIGKCYGKDMMGVRRLVSSHIPDAKWVVIEVCFSTEKTRLHVLKNGVTTAGGDKIIPLTTSTEVAKYTCLIFDGMMLFPTLDQIKSDIIQWCKLVIRDANNTSLCKYKHLPFVVDDDSVMWMEVDANGLYRGKGGVIFQGYDSRFTIGQAIKSSVYQFTQALSYPNARISIQQGYMYCSKCCHILNDHETADCIADIENCESADNTANTTKEQANKQVSQNVKDQDDAATKNSKKSEDVQSAESKDDTNEVPAVKEEEKDDNRSTDSFTIVDQ